MKRNNDETSDLTESLKKMLYMSVFLFSLSPTRHIPPPCPSSHGKRKHHISNSDSNDDALGTLR